MSDAQEELASNERAQDLVIPVSKLVRILLVEDEPGNALSLSEVLEHRGYSVQIATNPNEAKLCIDAMEFGMLISDQVFDGHSSSGDSFLLESRVGNIPKVLVTGRGVEGIERKAELDQRGIPILTKGDDNFHQQLESIAQEALAIAKERTMRQFSPETRIDDGSSRALREARELLLDWLSKRKDANAETLFYGGKSYSANTLMKEIQAGTSVGNAHIEMFLRVMRQAMGF
jgi:DNA-binding NtrC family response regulator